MSYDNTNSGALFKNKRKEKDTHPDYNGSVNIEGKEFWVSGWLKVAGPKAKNPGEKFFSLAFTPKDDAGGGTRGDTSSVDDDGSDVPF
jgi:hypothetical protein